MAVDSGIARDPDSFSDYEKEFLWEYLRLSNEDLGRVPSSRRPASENVHKVTFDCAPSFISAFVFTLRATMSFRGITASELARKVGIHKATLSRYLQGSTMIPVFAAYLICDALSVDLSRVITISLLLMDEGGQL